MRPLFPYQETAQKYVEARPLAFLGLDKRLGKTTLAYRWAKAHDLSRFLVVAPKSAIPGWVEQIELDGGLAWDLTSPRNLKLWHDADGDLPGEAFIINPQALFTSGKSGPAPKPIALHRWPGVIWDEIVNIKNPQSQINKIAHVCLGDVPYRCGLSGEYAPESPTDVFEQMRWIFGSFMGHANFWKWRNEFFVESGYDWLPKRGVLKLIKGLIGERGFVLSRKDAGVQNVAPYFDKRYCELPPRIRKVYDHAEKYFEIPSTEPESQKVSLADITFAHVVQPISGKSHCVSRFTNYVPVVRWWLLRLAGGFPEQFPELQSDHKAVLLRELLEGELSREPVVVSFRLNAEMFAAKAYLEPEIPCSMIWGDLSTDQRRIESQKFWEGKTRVMLKQACVHYGMDLSIADTMIRYSLPEAYNDLSQDADRIISPQKNSALMYVDLICRDTVDEDVAEAARDKKDNARYFMDRIAENFTKRLMAKGTLCAAKKFTT